jgi:hypothetical protein
MAFGRVPQTPQATPKLYLTIAVAGGAYHSEGFTVQEFEAEYTAALSGQRMMHVGDTGLVISPYRVPGVQKGYHSASGWLPSNATPRAATRAPHASLLNGATPGASSAAPGWRWPDHQDGF